MTYAEIDSALNELRNLKGESADERKLRLMELKEQFRLQGLYDLNKQPDEQADGDTAADRELSAVRGHLEPLGLAPPGTSAAELARLAALKITEK
jgi:hypothetical protein